MAPGEDGDRRGPATAFQAAIFDMDGLLIDSEPLWREAEIGIFGRLGVPLTEELCLETRGMVLTEVTRYWFDRYPWEAVAPDAVALEIIDAMALLLDRRATAKPGVETALTSCRAQGLRLAVASSSPRRLIETVLDRLGIRDRFDVVHSAETEPAGKPDPAVFLTAARLLAVAPDDCVVFEDSPAGVEAAVAAGMTSVAVPEVILGSDDRSRSFERADLVIDSLERVDDALWARLRSVRRGRRRRGEASAGSSADSPGNSR